LAIYSQFAQEESISISKNVRIGVHKRMADGTYKNCSVPYGFIYKNGQIIPDENKSETVRQIFEWYADGIGAEEISARLNRNGIPAPCGKCWRTPRISEILANEKYIGDTLLQKKFTTDTLPFRQVENRGEKPQYYISDTHQPIIERTLFDAVQKLMKARKTSANYTPQRNTFSRKIKCVCGGTFRRKKNRDKIYWVCRNHDHKNIGNCDIRQIGEWVFQDAFVRLWNKLQAHYKAILAPMLRQLETLSEKEKSGNVQLAELRKEIAEIKQQIHLLARLNSQDTLDDAYFKSRSQELDRKLLTAQKRLNSSLDEDSETLNELRKLIGIFEKSEPISEFDEIKFEQIIEKIIVLSESEIRFELIGGIGFTEPIERC
ncbi:MAG: recombinase family protein, partial [Eubacterium sp.]|nr:recombinase family protein [Eubacterium sp.]